MFKRLFISLGFVSCSALVFSQSISPSVLGTGGGSVVSNGYRIDFNIGELAIQSAGNGPIITEGFEQPEMGEISLPVHGLKLQVKPDKGHALLSFSTVQEFKSDYFIAERSMDGLHFDSLAQIKSGAPNGYSSVPLYYNYRDPAPLKGTVYYRIVHVDFNGDLMYSSVVPISENNQNALKVYPNPATSQVMVHLGNPFAETRIQVYSSAGALMYSKTISGKSGVTIQLSKWSAGIYLIVTETKGVVQKAKFIKK